ncbi:serine hydrolase domain-containing protein [Massilia terrae]|uniref:Beta-lactamase family protein n=1 Tax=Massilia terrae TaxID=1811224 RepID=A0ABT2D3F4_9BURK|nr:serine hydrolase domain-containing protein [Massilia terrae]MCS0659858.1 beta-lactamase family protein [Massilia terrae]
MVHRRDALLGLALLGAMQPLAALAKGKGDDFARLDAELAAVVNNPACELASLSVVAVRKGRIAYERQFGRRFISKGSGNGAAPDKPVDRRTLFRIASISKTMTMLGLLRLVEAGKVDLDADVSRYLGFQLRNPHFPDRAITLRHLVTHRSSLRDEAGYSWGVDTALKDVLAPGARLYQDATWASNAGPGDYFTYCNLGWGITGTIMEAVTGERFDRLQQRLLIQPLGLTAGYNPAELPGDGLANLATLYRKRSTDDDAKWDPAGPWVPQVDDYSSKPAAEPAGLDHYVPGVNATPFSPTGGMRISAHDMAVVMLALMHGGVHAGKRIWKQASLDQMFTRQWTFDGHGGNGDSLDGLFNAWGLGNEQWPDDPATRTRVVEGGGFAPAGHLGDAYGVQTLFMADLKKKNGIIALVGGTSTDPLAYKGQYSSLARFQEQILTSTFRRAILMQQA